MKHLVKAAVVTAALALGSTAAMAQTIPPDPPNPIPQPLDGNGGLIFWAWDPVRNVSLTVNLGLTLNDVLPSTNMTSGAGFTLNFGELGGYSAAFSGSQATNIQWGVGTADFASPFRLVATGPTDPTGLFMNVGGVNASAGFANTYIFGINFACPTTDSCFSPDQNQTQYAGQRSWAENFGGGLGWNATANPGQALGFYLVSNPPGRPTSQTPATIQQYANAAGIGQWLLSTAGQLTYSIPAVPLPAAAWLLISGLLGFGVVSRRREAGAKV